jgi:hypothetical protein
MAISLKKGRGQRKECVERREERECGDVVRATNVRSGNESIISFS